MSPDVRNAVAQRGQQQADKQAAVARYIEKLGPQIARALPKHLDADRMTRLALTAVRQTPALATCSDVSMAGALLTAAALGLEPNTPTAECYLVPYKNEVQLILGYQGVTKLYFQSPLAKTLRAEAVYESDEFDYSYGTGAFLRHKPSIPRSGKVIAFYAHATLTTGAEAFVVMTPEEVKAVRGGKVGPSGNIADPQMWMSRKVLIKQLMKLLPKSANLARVDQVDEQGGTDLYRTMAAERVDVPGDGAFDNAERPAIEGSVDTSTGEIITPESEGIPQDSGDWPATAKPGSR